ncbi:MAG TPA: FAD-binding oxidoreductase [Streptosporangiaceae bacterium]|nr:FAD-binding oxidoreductase [Streptosporangiaceae bacterium]
MSPASVPGALARACRAVRPGGPWDAVGGLTPPWVASPADTGEASALLAAASEHELAVVPRGSGTSVSWGVPPRRLDLVIDTLRLDRVIEHAAGDLVVRAQAGVTLDQLGGVLATARQQLALDAAPGPGGQASSPTVGGVLATGAAGPRRLRYGTPRDLLIGITVIRPDGTVTKSGGKVVKNVAGYDLGKLYTGSRGTLGLITEAIFRLHPLPAATVFVTAGYADPAAAAEGVAAAAGSDLAPVAIEIDRPARDGLIRVAVLLEGDPGGLSERASLMRGVLGAGTATLDAAPPWWGAGPATPGSGAAAREGSTLIQIGFWAAALPGVLGAVDAAGRAAGLDPAVAGSAAAGVLHATVPGTAEPENVAGFLAGLRERLARDLEPGFAGGEGPPARASAVVVRAPAAVQALIDMWGPVPSLGLMRALKDQFDPGHLMAPGRFAGGI